MGHQGHPADEDKVQSEGRKANAAQPLNAAPANAGAERYPAVNKDDSVDKTGEGRSFGSDMNAPANPRPRQGAGDSSLHQPGLDGEPARPDAGAGTSDRPSGRSGSTDGR